MTEKKVWLKKHASPDGVVLAACDEDVVGKTLTEGKIHFEAKERFYRGTLISTDELRNELREAENANLVGKTCVNAAIKEGLLNEKDAKYIQGIPHALVVRLV